MQIYLNIFEDSVVDRNLEWVYSLESLGLSDKETLSDYDTQNVEEFMENRV